MRYSERLRAPVSWWVIGLFFAVSFATAVGFVLDPVVSLGGGGLAAALVTAGLGWDGSAAITGDLGEAIAHSASDTRDRLGRGADRRALLVVRGYIPTSVEVAIADPADPHPYWLISTRRPDELAAALTELRDRMPR